MTFRSNRVTSSAQAAHGSTTPYHPRESLTGVDTHYDAIIEGMNRWGDLIALLLLTDRLTRCLVASSETSDVKRSVEPSGSYVPVEGRSRTTEFDRERDRPAAGDHYSLSLQ